MGLEELWGEPITWAVLGLAVTGLVGAVLKDVMVGQISKAVQSWRPSSVFEISSYKARLRERMAEMPFLYRDMRLSAKDDYVETVVSTADGLAKPIGQPNLDYRTTLIRFKEARKAVLFGDGGFGKTTLFRHIVLRMLDKNASAFFEKSLVPVFVALKTVRLSSDYPILDSIQTSDPYFEGDRGYRRLRRLAKRRRLVIFLDGYDELPYAGGLQHVLRELETFFGYHYWRTPTFFEASKDFYIFAQDCRIYISSRREFFFHNPFDLPPNAPKWLVRGLGDRRAELVEKIFAKYKASNSYFSGRLDQELFLQQLADACDANLEALSFSPLFLTVMCYVYIDAVKQESADGAQVFTGGAPALVKKCISLLISDVDEYKARGLGDIQREALLRRRSAYPQEKYEFLRYFAAQLYEQDIGVFSRQHLMSHAKRFFAASNFVDAEKIEKGIDSDDPTVNLVDQLIFCGLFVLVDYRSGNKILDFPHRRFRETLAVAYYDSAEGADVIAENFDRASYGELSLVYVEQSKYSDRVLGAVSERVRRGSYNQGHGEFLADALSRIGGSRAEVVSHDFVELLSGFPECRAPVEVLAYLPRREIYAQELKRKLADAVVRARSDVSLRLQALSAVCVSWPVDVYPLIERASPYSLRALMYTPVAYPDSLVSLLIDRVVEGCSGVDELRQALTDIYAVFYVGRSHQNRALVSSRMRHHSPVLATLFGVEKSAQSLLPRSVDHVFGGVGLAEGETSCLNVGRTVLPAPVMQLYVRE